MNFVPEQGGSNILFVDAFGRIETLPKDAFLLASKHVEVEFNHSKTKRRGSVDVVLQSSAIAFTIAPKGERTSVADRIQDVDNG